MSREHFHESQIEDRIADLMEKGMSDEDAIRQAESEYDGQVNLVEDKALKIHEKNKEDEKALRIAVESYGMTKDAIIKELNQGVYASEKLLALVIEHLKKHYKDENEIRSTRQFCRKLLMIIEIMAREINNAE
jgi:uncharacterized protein YoaH (UPF0181 family)